MCIRDREAPLPIKTMFIATDYTASPSCDRMQLDTCVIPDASLRAEFEKNGVRPETILPCGIPVRVTSFCSLRGYTVLRILKDFGDKNGERNVFNYFAAGWNRDGLALRGAGELIKSAPAEKHLLILLTDASPDDSHKILPSGKVPLSRDYDGQIGVDDTAEEVRALRAQGIRVAAVFMGENASVPAANAIYGRDLARIRRIDQLAATAGRLIQDEIRELSG